MGRDKKMTDIMEMNKSIFGTSFKQSSRLPKRTRQAMKSALVVPVCAHEMTYEDCEQTDGGGTIYNLMVSAR